MSALKPGPTFVARKVLSRLRNRGVREVLSVAGQRIRETIYSSETLIFLARAARADFEPPNHDPGLEFREAIPDDGRLYEELIGTDSVRTFALRLNAGARCFFVLAGGSLLHSSWVTEGPAWTREIRRFFQPPPGDAYVYESFTTSEARGRGVYPFALSEICAHLDRERKRLVWVGVEESNTASRKAIAKAHFKEHFRVRYVSKLGYLRVDEPVGAGVRLCFGCLAHEVGGSSQGTSVESQSKQ
jgi:hypothetical protein